MCRLRRKSQRDFVANVSHELKTPLTSVQGFAQAILDGTADTPESHQQAARVIYNEAGSMHRMVLDLLDLARLDAGTLELQCAPVDLPALLNNIAEKFSPQAHAAGVSIQVESAALPAVMGDGDRLAQVFSNLVDNALKHTPAGGTITLRARLAGLKHHPGQVRRFRWTWQIPAQAFHRKLCRTSSSVSTRLTHPARAARNTEPAWVWRSSRKLWGRTVVK